MHYWSKINDDDDDDDDDDEVCCRCSLGAGHDGVENTCSFDDQYIMAAYSVQLTDDNFLNAFTFSPCSISEIRIFLRQLATSTRSACTAFFPGAICISSEILTVYNRLYYQIWFITFCVSRRRRKMYCGHARLCVCLSVCLSVCP